MEKTILCLDISLSCTGYAIFNGQEELVDKGVINTSKIKNTNPEIHGKKLLCIFNILNKLEKKHNFDVIVIERGFILYNKASKAIQKVFGVTELLFNSKPIILYSPATVKKHMCGGKGKISKEDIIKAVNFQYGLEIKSNDEADAIALGSCYFASQTV